MGISLQVSSLDRLTPNDKDRLFTELFKKLENYLNNQVTIYVRTDPKQVYPKFKKGDLLFDLTNAVGTIQLFVYNGVELLPLSFESLVGGIDFDDISGFINLITRGIGSGNDASLYLKSDGADHWELAAIPDPPDPLPQLEPLSDGLVPTPEILFDAITGDVLMHEV